jgi:hypothetical protein
MVSYGIGWTIADDHQEHDRQHGHYRNQQHDHRNVHARSPST